LLFSFYNNLSLRKRHILQVNCKIRRKKFFLLRHPLAPLILVVHEKCIEQKSAECYYLQLLSKHFFCKLIRERDIRYNLFSHIFQDGGQSALRIVPPTSICTPLYPLPFYPQTEKKNSIYDSLNLFFFISTVYTGQVGSSSNCPDSYVILDFRREVSVKSALLAYYTASSGSLLTRFWEVYFWIVAC
jgi:hypothetical protein